MKIKIALIGNGKIARFHVDALKALGAEVSVVHREHSHTAELFCRNHSIQSSYTEKEFLEDSLLIQSFDGMLIACDTENHLKYLKKATGLRIPALVEKPVSYNVDSLLAVSDYPWVFVGFNRRYYASVLVLKQEISQNSGVFMECTLPQISRPGSKEFGGRLNGVFSNLVHYFDLVRFLMGEPNLEWRTAIDSTGSIIAQYKCPRGVVVVKVLIDYPEAMGIKAYMNGVVYNLRPIEALEVFREMAVVEPTPEFPLRRYEPQSQYKIKSMDSTELKPGFYEQAEAFIDCIRKFQGSLAHPGVNMPGVNDALAAQVLLQELYKDYL